MNLTLIVPSYNNIEYLKLCYSSVRAANSDVKMIIVDDGSTDGTSDWLKTIDDTNVIKIISDQRYGHTRWYDEAIEMVTTDNFGILHSDMVVPPNFFDLLMPELKPLVVVSARCIEPPLHPAGAEKVVLDFGMYPSEFIQSDFEQFVEKQSEAMKGVMSSALFAPWFMRKVDYLETVGGHDKQFAPYGHEDADLFVRMRKCNLHTRQIHSLMVYHFTQRGHRWSKGKVGEANADYSLQMQITQNRFVSKWGTMHWKDENHTPLSIPLYKKRLVIKNYITNKPELEVVNRFFNVIEAEADGKRQVIYTDPFTGAGEINYTLTIDYSQAYGNELMQLLHMIPFFVEENEVGEHKFSETVGLVIHHKEELNGKV